MRGKDLTNMQFEKLFVIERGPDHVTATTGKKMPRWLCRCECGKEVLIQTSSLVEGRSTSCGCNKRAEDLSNMRFGELVVKERGEDWVNPKTGKISVRWVCKCSCDNIVTKFGNNLKAKKIKSCGTCNNSESRDFSHERFNQLNYRKEK